MATKPLIIGITGNIASGKSVVSQYLQNLGCFTIDADGLGQRILEKDAPAFEPVLAAFGKKILDESGQIDRRQLADIVFADTDKLSLLESISHPLVLTALNNIIARVDFPVVVVEAIKLFESGFADHCDSVWTVAADDAIRLRRLITERNLTLAEARYRMECQAPQAEKISQSDEVIYTNDAFSQTLQQVREVFSSLVNSTPPHNLGMTTDQDSLHRLTPVDIPFWKSFLEKANQVEYDQEAIDKMLGFNAFWVLTSGQAVLGHLAYKQRIGVVLIESVEFLNNSAWALLNQSTGLIEESFRKELVEWVYFNPDISLGTIQFFPHTQTTAVIDINYAYRAFLRARLKPERDLSCKRLVSSQKFLRIFKP